MFGFRYWLRCLQGPSWHGTRGILSSLSTQRRREAKTFSRDFSLHTRSNSLELEFQTRPQWDASIKSKSKMALSTIVTPRVLQVLPTLVVEGQEGLLRTLLVPRRWWTVTPPRGWATPLSPPSAARGGTCWRSPSLPGVASNLSSGRKTFSI